MKPHRFLLLAGILAVPASLLAVLPPGLSAPAPLKAKKFTNSLGMKFVLIPAGKFTMGSPAEEGGRNANEIQHEVQISQPFFMGVCAVTQAEYQKVMGSNPSAFSAAGANRSAVGGMGTTRFPVETVSWDDAVKFCARLSALPAEKGARRVYRLPTEAEWEYACRAGTTTPFHFGKTASPRDGNFYGSYPGRGLGAGARGLGRPTTVGSYKPNAWGLFDMHGNITQWCSDWYESYYYKDSPNKDPKGPAKASIRVLRGGTFCYSAGSCRAAHRDGIGPTARHNFIGFRAACTASR
jgi:formylglycine-generating enzyme required for sulfatase activity